MAQHFLLSSRARKLSLMQIAKMSDSEAVKAFADIRWHSNGGNPICPNCGNTSKIYLITTRNEYKCNECHKRFSVTSETLFHSHKLPLQTLLCAIVLFVNAVKGISALQLSRDLDIQYKSAFVLLHKLRESLIDYQSDEPFSGVCEIDGVYVGNYIRPKNNINDRIDRRKAFKPNKRVVISLRQRDELGSGANKSRTFILKSENTFDINNIVCKHILRGSEVHTDENVGYSDLSAYYTHKVVNHAVEYMGSADENNNQSESYNARFRRLEYGQCHKLSVLYLSNYANEISYREDTRRLDNGAIFKDILGKCLNKPISNEFCGYWQGNHRVNERLGA